MANNHSEPGELPVNICRPEFMVNYAVLDCLLKGKEQSRCIKMYLFR